MLLNKRQKDILQILENAKNFVTVESIALSCGLSRRTIYTELNVIADYLQSLGNSLEKKRGVGVQLVKSGQNNFGRTKKDLDLDRNVVLERRLKIMSYLLFEEKALTYQSLSDQFLVSKTSIAKDFEFITSVLTEDREIKLVGDRYGTRLAGSEVGFQKAMLRFNRFIMDHVEIYSKEMMPHHLDILSRYYGDEIVKTCQNIFYTYIRENISVISDHYVQNLLSSLIVLVYRCAKGYHHKQRTKSSEKFFEESSVKILEKVNLRLGILFSTADNLYFSRQLVLNRFEKGENQASFDDFTKKLLVGMSQSLKVSFLQDSKLKQQLAEHIPAMLYRLQANVIVENPFTDQIKREFALIFNLLSLLIVEIEKNYQVIFNENEIAFLTIYFQSAIERAKINKRILVVCQMGVATSELLVNRIKQALPSLDTLELSSVAELEYMDIDKFDFIISTVHLNIPNKDIVLVSPFLTEKDMENIKIAGYKPSIISNTKAATKFHHLYNFLTEEEMILNAAFPDKKSFFKEFGRELVERGIVKQAFIDDLFHRENLGATDLPVGVAIPHGNPQNSLKSKIFLIKNSKKIKWGDYFVDLIFVICISTEDRLRSKGLLSDIYNIIDCPQYLQLIRKEKSASNILNKLYGGNANG